MSVFNNPKEWADEMNRIMAQPDIINKDNYLTDLANAVVYVRETADKNEKLQAKVKELESDKEAMKVILKCEQEKIKELESLVTAGMDLETKLHNECQKVKELEEQVKGMRIMTMPVLGQPKEA